ncbi:MAG: hypothetical protein IAA72_09425 [Spirochaetes bacterium]|uniref:Uncharacterized protein n=1 Tax=Candidatus Ornithospirochaeta stercoravium TaxID=2840897 RepID=A0A9D9ICB1_9SPIO|nr:hypothetical protein [Candidatus Ornithospirochaeta stercoravium]
MDGDKETGWVSIVSYDGNGGDLETYLDMPLAIWRRIEQGEDITLKGTGAYEGLTLTSSWHFKDRLVTIWQESDEYGGAECAIDKPIEKLAVDID